MKKIVFLILALALIFGNTALGAGEVEFSDMEADYMMDIDFDINAKQYSHVYYVMLKKGYFSDFVKSFKNAYEDENKTYPEEIRIALEEGGGISPVVDQKVLPFIKYTMGNDTVKNVYNVTCESIKTNEVGKGAFRCTDVRKKNTDLSSRDMLIKYITNRFSTYEPQVSFHAADGISSPYFSLREMLIRGNADDKDENGIPDSFEVTPEDVSLPPTEGCLGDKDCDGVTDAMDECPDEAGELKLAGCPPAAGETAKLPAGAPSEDVIPGIPRGFDEGGMCSFISSVSANPASCLLIAAALVALSRRRRK